MKSFIKTGIIILFLGVALYAEVTLEEIVQMHEEASQAIRTGRISFTREYRESERHIRSTMSDTPEEDFETVFKIKALKRNYTDETNLIFDADRNAFKQLKTSRRDLAKLIDELMAEDDVSAKDIHGELMKQLSNAEEGYFYLNGGLNATRNSSALDGISYNYWSGKDATFYIRKDDGHRPNEYLIRERGFIRPSALERYKEVEIEENPSDSNQVILRFILREDKFKYILDRSLGYRIVSTQSSDENGYGHRGTIEYRKFGDQIFPAVTNGGLTYPGGEFRRGSRTVITAAEFNLPIDESEFKLEPPPDARIYDAIAGTRLPSREETADANQRSLDFLLKEILETEQAAKAKADEPAPLQTEVLEEKQAEVEVSPEREEAREGGFWIVLGLLILAVVIILVFLMRKRR